jgi:hypothetical protein
MKRTLTLASPSFQKLFFVISTLLMALITFAQDKKEIDVNVNSNKNNFWGQPWVWVVGAAVFILLLVAILRSGRRGDA